MEAEFYSFLNSFVIFQYVVCAASPSAVTAFAGFPFINIIINKTGIWLMLTWIRAADYEWFKLKN